MNTLRWILGTIAVGLGGGFVVLTVMGNAFRKSFGASTHGPLFIVLPMLGIALLLAAILFPGHKPLLHIAAVIALALIAFCLWQIFAQGNVSFWFAVIYLGAWLSYYWLATRRVLPQS